jgi:hypothetical protein
MPHREITAYPVKPNQNIATSSRVRPKVKLEMQVQLLDLHYPGKRRQE